MHPGLWSADLVRLLRHLEQSQVQYLMIGGFAVNLHGYNRNTGDVDLLIEVSETNAGRLISALTAFGINDADMLPVRFLDPSYNVELEIPPRKVEFIKRISGVSFAEAFQRRENFEYDGITVPVISLSDLIENKLRARRYKDLDDVAKLTGRVAPELNNNQPPSRQGFWARLRYLFTGRL
jgi:predicted nucleotidyltransferase